MMKKSEMLENERRQAESESHSQSSDYNESTPPAEAPELQAWAMERMGMLSGAPPGHD